VQMAAVAEEVEVAFCLVVVSELAAAVAFS
jgi:hypothetical protein